MKVAGLFDSTRLMVLINRIGLALVPVTFRTSGEDALKETLPEQLFLNIVVIFRVPHCTLLLSQAIFLLISNPIFVLLVYLKQHEASNV